MGIGHAFVSLGASARRLTKSTRKRTTVSGAMSSRRESAVRQPHNANGRTLFCTTSWSSLCRCLTSAWPVPTGTWKNQRTDAGCAPHALPSYAANKSQENVNVPWALANSHRSHPPQPRAPEFRNACDVSGATAGALKPEPDRRGGCGFGETPPLAKGSSEGGRLHRLGQ